MVRFFASTLVCSRLQYASVRALSGQQDDKDRRHQGYPLPAIRQARFHDTGLSRLSSSDAVGDISVLR